MTVRTLKENTNERLDWKDQLSEIKGNFQPPPPMSPQEWQTFKKRMKSSVEKAAVALELSPIVLANRLKSMGITINRRRKLTTKDYIPLIKRFKADFYQQNLKYFKEFLPPPSRDNKHVHVGSSKIEKKGQVLRAKPMEQRYVPVIEIKNLLVNWENVHFEDFAIVIKDGINYSMPFAFSEARKSFKFLKKYILGLKREPLQVIMIGNKIISIENLEQLKDLVTILKVRNEFIEQFKKSVPVSIKSILKIIEPLSVHFLVEVAKANTEDFNFIDYLTEKQAPEYKPIPVFEIIPTGQTFHSEDTFIFTIRIGSTYYLIWESTLPGRATYIFTATAESYEETVQQIYDYIASAQKAKRMKLRKKDEQAAEMNCLTYITHSSFDHWKEKLERVIMFSGLFSQSI